MKYITVKIPLSQGEGVYYMASALPLDGYVYIAFIC